MVLIDVPAFLCYSWYRRFYLTTINALLMLILNIRRGGEKLWDSDSEKVSRLLQALNGILIRKSSSITFGGKGIHHTINSKGQTTDSIGVPRTGIYYTKPQKRGTVLILRYHRLRIFRPTLAITTETKKKRGCLFYFLMLVVICIALAFLPLLWLPAIGFIIYFALKKDEPKTKRRNILISSLILIVSIIAFVNFDTSASLTQIEAEWDKRNIRRFRECNCQHYTHSFRRICFCSGTFR